MQLHVDFTSCQQKHFLSVSEIACLRHSTRHSADQNKLATDMYARQFNSANKYLYIEFLNVTICFEINLSKIIELV